MSHTIKTGQLDLGGLSNYLNTSLSGSATNTEGFYPYTGNPADFAHSGYVTEISGAISGYVDSVSGVLDSRLVQSGTTITDELRYADGLLKADITFLSGKNAELSGEYANTKILSLQNVDDIDIVSGELGQSGLDLKLLITGQSGDGVSGFVTGFVNTTSGELNVKISNLDTRLRGHVSEDYLSKKLAGTAGISGYVHFDKTPRFKQSLELERVGSHGEIATYQSGINLYAISESVDEAGAAHQSMTTFLRYPHSGDSVAQNLIVGSFLYSGVIP